MSTDSNDYDTTKSTIDEPRATLAIDGEEVLIDSFTIHRDRPATGRPPQGHCFHCGEPLPMLIDGCCPNCRTPFDGETDAAEAEPPTFESGVWYSLRVDWDAEGNTDTTIERLDEDGADAGPTPAPTPAVGVFTGAPTPGDDGPEFTDPEDRDPRLRTLTSPCRECGGTIYRLIYGMRAMCQGCGDVRDVEVGP